MDRGRGRGRPSKRRGNLSSHHHTSPSDPGNPTTSVTTVDIQRVPNTAPQRGGRSSSKPTLPSFTQSASASSDPAHRVTPRSDRQARSATFESPPTAIGMKMPASAASSRKRARTFEPLNDGAADEEAVSKGGHSLRKRARIDYTQEQIDDDHVSSAAKLDLFSKATTPSARNRKRKGALNDSDNEAEDHASTQKRRRTDKSPAGPRSRRRNTARKATTDVSPYVDQPSDNEVQDTILVGVSMEEEPEDSEDDSEHSSFQQSASRSSSPEGSDAEQGEANPVTPEPELQVVPKIEEAVSFTLENDGALAKDLPGQSDEATPSPLEPVDAEVADTAEHMSTAEHHDVEHQSTSQLAAISTHQQPDPTPVIKITEPEAKPDTKQEPGVGPEAAVQNERQSSSSPASFPSPSHSTSPQPPATALSSSESSRIQKSSQPARLKQVEHIYGDFRESAVSAAQHEYFPYEGDDVIYPAPWTEWVHPDEEDKADLTPMLTPRPSPPPARAHSLEIKWDGRRPLKESEFYNLYRQEMRSRAERGDARISLGEFQDECARRFKTAQNHGQDGPAGSFIQGSRHMDATAAGELVRKRPTQAAVASFDEMSGGSQAPDSEQPTAAPSPEAMDDDIATAQVEGGEDDQDVDGSAEGAIKDDSPVEPVEVTRVPKKQYAFPKVRDPLVFLDAVQGHQDMDTTELYERLAAAAEALDAWQREYNELKKITDDEENAKRRQANDKTIANWENRQKLDEPAPFRRHFDDVVKGPAAFELRGARAPKPYVDDPVLEHQREDDRIMAQAYGFKHNNHATLVGRQNPDEQRWEMPESRLRDRKKTEKAADLAEENVVEGKRARKPRVLSDQSKEPSRAPTPVAPTRRRRRNAALISEGTVDGTFRKKRGPGPRGTVWNSQPEPSVGAPHATNQTDDEAVDEQPKGARKRGRGAAAVEAPATVPAPVAEKEEEPEAKEPEAKEPEAKRQRTGRNATSHEITTSSFYSNPSSAADTRAESPRPSTASSQATENNVETVESSYSLRDKKKRNFALENDPELERSQARARATLPTEPAETKKRKRGRKPATSPQPEEHMSPLPPASQPAGPQPTGGLKAPAHFIAYAGPGGAPNVPQGPHPPQPPVHDRYMHTFDAGPDFKINNQPPPLPEPPAPKKPITRIRFTNKQAKAQHRKTPVPIAPNPSSIQPAPSPTLIPAPLPAANSASKPKASRGPKFNAAVGAKDEMNKAIGDMAEKPYAEMSKSEKMSWSMRRRWATGEMQAAVEKRRTTLANKKAEKAAGGPTLNGPDFAGANYDETAAAEAESAGPSTTHTTPVPPAGPLALPHYIQPPPQPLQQPGHLLPQPPIAYSFPPPPPAGPLA
ncbi:hypothetical protein QBC46DRAFT_416027 [Diplogelasinospora grovesii]|uniref:Uncharacterized protein n=1 Tax=Diplogelasinospora grovesii TaxID=303347 RepID=A0AAN6N1M0_9PEZI|nr:hypothetical protein QBC46DRAFT_416027 [Diplogelasinospora grovesii]